MTARAAAAIATAAGGATARKRGMRAALTRSGEGRLAVLWLECIECSDTP